MFVTSHLVIRSKRLLLYLSKFSVNSAVFECTQLECVHVLMYSQYYTCLLPTHTDQHCYKSFPVTRVFNFPPGFRVFGMNKRPANPLFLPGGGGGGFSLAESFGVTASLPVATSAGPTTKFPLD